MKFYNKVHLVTDIELLIKSHELPQLLPKDTQVIK